ncbi:MAG: protein-methionine-sulfoxide reductase catalytic subunit MsrP [Acidobacteria bacterium]|nr:MAG: protein-methionine-sulfoxide reductase catalytic subunit MsrP [Acidobacteriota bacterium]REK09736.1 MAG: protein-methionine-sulfoxide reductase catalytic subunit MsrP [Acidobacteriota bacterium]
MRRSADPRDRRVTPPEVFWDRRRIVRGLSLGIGLAALPLPAAARSAAGRSGRGAQESAGAAEEKERTPLDVPLRRPEIFPAQRNPAFTIPTGIAPQQTERLLAATHNNFYEFLPGRGGPVWEHTADFEVEPWSVEVVGECAKPRTFDLDALFSFAQEERLYHFRCVERWAMNVPWSGFPLRKLLEAVEPSSKAKHVRFVTARRDEQMPGVREASYYDWPYYEGLRIDEATHPLTFAVMGAYGEPLLKQHGAPIRIAVPWKYGYKSPKSIVRIELVEEQPRTFWQRQPHEYGFLSNVNPYIPHPRWPQTTSYWLGSEEPFETQLFNGYAEQVAGLYPDEPRTPQQPLTQGQIAR